MSSPGRLVLGLSIVAAGLVYLAETAGWLDAGDTISRWWPVVLVALGLVQLSADRDNWIGPAVLIVVGLVLLGLRLDVLGDDAWRYLWPLALIGFGTWVLVGRGRREGGPTHGEVNVVAVFTGREVKVGGDGAEPFTGGDVTVILGSADLDLTRARITGTATVTATVVLGSLDVLVPEGWRVTISGTPILAGWDDTTRRSSVPADAPNLEIRGLAILGGIEVRHLERWK
jgi:hypothetical protein